MPALDVKIEDLSQWIDFRFDRSAGPGGQNVNKVNTRVTLYFDLKACDLISAARKKLIRSRLATRISTAGRLRVVSQRSRSQAANRNAAEEKLLDLLRTATHVDKTRRPTRPSRMSKERRLAEKKHRGEKKRLRRQGFSQDH